MIRFTCPHCRLALAAREDQAGQTVACRCGQRMTVPDVAVGAGWEHATAAPRERARRRAPSAAAFLLVIPNVVFLAAMFLPWVGAGWALGLFAMNGWLVSPAAGALAVVSFVLMILAITLPTVPARRGLAIAHAIVTALACLLAAIPILQVAGIGVPMPTAPGFYIALGAGLVAVFCGIVRATTER